MLTDKDKELIKEKYASCGYKIPGLSRYAKRKEISNYANGIGVRREGRNELSIKDKVLIRKQYELLGPDIPGLECKDRRKITRYANQSDIRMRKKPGVAILTENEKKIILEKYPRFGANIKGINPDVSSNVIRQYANKNGVYRDSGINYKTSDYIDNKIKEFYASDSKDFNGLSVEINRSISWIKIRAANIGIATKMDAKWTKEEEAIVSENSSKTTEGIRRELKKKGYNRSVFTIRKRLNKLGLNLQKRNDGADGMTTEELSELMGVSVRTVNRWIAVGKIQSVKRGVMYAHLIPYNSLRTFFIRERGAIEWRLCKSIPFVIDILTNPLMRCN